MKLLIVLLGHVACLAAPVMGAEGWRVIAEDPKFLADDVVVAFCSVTDAAYNLPDDPASRLHARHSKGYR